MNRKSRGQLLNKISALEKELDRYKCNRSWEQKKLRRFIERLVNGKVIHKYRKKIVGETIFGCGGRSSAAVYQSEYVSSCATIEDVLKDGGYYFCKGGLVPVLLIDIQLGAINEVHVFEKLDTWFTLNFYDGYNNDLQALVNTTD